jgi:quercetin 2,3-dioxygenase
MITIRSPESIYQAHGEIEHGTFRGRWHFSFAEYDDPEHMGFGPLRVFNDDTLSPGAIWPLHHHEEIEVVTYCVQGVFRHADQGGEGGILKPGWAQHTTVGSGMYHSEINANPDEPMRFIQLWFLPDRPGLKPSVEQKRVEKAERIDRLLPLVSNHATGALRIHQDVEVFSSFVRDGLSVAHMGKKGRGAYLYVIDGGPVMLNGRKTVPNLGAALVTDEPEMEIQAQHDSAELLLVDVPLR